jgi:hypothetical protein
MFYRKLTASCSRTHVNALWRQNIEFLNVNPAGMKLNGTHHLLAYADDVNILGESVHTVRENAEALVVATKEIGLEVNTDKTKYVHGYVSGSGCRAESRRED